VVIVTSHFVPQAKWVSAKEGMPDFNIIEVPHPLGGLPKDKIGERAEAVLDAIIDALTGSTEQRKVSKSKSIMVKPEPEIIQISGKSGTEAIRAVNSLFYESKWTDGLPIVPPTQEAVDWMLTGTDRSPDEVVGIVAPGNGKATVRNIAINAVMAGARPSYFPVIIAAIEAVTDTAFASGVVAWGTAGMQGTTGPVTPLLIVNGPVSTDVGIESGVGCFSRGHQANATIGRAVRLVLINAGRAYIGVNDMKGQGSSQEFTFCVAEREQHYVYQHGANPWIPLHRERGYPAGSSTVTAVAAFPPVNVEDAEHCGAEILNAVVDTMATLGQVPYAMDWEYVLVIGQTHARCLADAGLSKQDIREFIYANAVMPWGKYKRQYPGVQALQPEWLSGTYDDSTSVHIMESPENIHIIVAGGECPYSQIVRCSFRGATRKIQLPVNWAEILKADSKSGITCAC